MKVDGAGKGPERLSREKFNQVFSNKFVLNALFIDGALAVVFILVHSFFRMESVKRFWEKVGLKEGARAIYCLISALTLLVSFKNPLYV